MYVNLKTEMKSLADSAALDAMRGKKRRMKFLKRLESIRKWKEETHKARMTLGGVELGPIKEMTGREMHERNLNLEKKYYDSMDGEGKTNSKLMRWKQVDFNVEDTERYKYLHGTTIGS